MKAFYLGRGQSLMKCQKNRIHLAVKKIYDFVSFFVSLVKIFNLPGKQTLKKSLVLSTFAH